MKSFVIAAAGAGIKKFVRIDYDNGVSLVEDKTAASVYPFDFAYEALDILSVFFYTKRLDLNLSVEVLE